MNPAHGCGVMAQGVNWGGISVDPLIADPGLAVLGETGDIENLGVRNIAMNIFYKRPDRPER